MKFNCIECELEPAITERGMCNECDENYDFSLKNRKKFDAMMSNAHPDSIVGMMKGLKKSVDNFNREKDD